MESLELKTGNVTLPTAYLPPIRWFIVASKAGKALIETQETYSKQTLRNRCQIYSANGLFNLTVPVTRPYGNHTPTSGVTIFNQTPWRIKHWRAIESAYNSSPWFLYYKDEIYRHFTGDLPCLLFDFNLEIIQTLIEITGLDITIELTSEFQPVPDSADDFRWLAKPGARLTNIKQYNQVFISKFGFLPDLSIIDLLFNLGPETKAFLLDG